MKNVFLCALIALSFAVSAQSNKNVVGLNLDKTGLDKSAMVTVNGQEVPLLVLTEIQKICDQRNYSQEVCEDLIATGCAEYKTTVESKAVQTKTVYIEIPVRVHVHEHEHTVDYAQENRVYNYSVDFSTSKSTSHETKVLPTRHVVGTVQVKETVLNSRPDFCRPCQQQGKACGCDLPLPTKSQYVAPAPQGKVNTPAFQGKVNAPAVNLPSTKQQLSQGCDVDYSCEMVYPANTQFTQELSRRVRNACNSCQFFSVNQGRMVLVRGGGLVARVRARLVNAFPRATDFVRANRAQRKAFFNSCRF